MALFLGGGSLLQEFSKFGVSRSGFPEPEVWVIYGKSEKPLLKFFRQQQGIKFFHADLVHTAAFLASCDVFVSTSTGPLHLAIAQDTPTVGIMEDFDYQHWTPDFGRHEFINGGNDIHTVPVDTLYDAVLRLL